MPIWTANEVFAVLKEIPENLKALFWCLALTSVRIGEVSGLRRKDIDLANRTITFQDNLWRGDLQGSTKTDEVMRSTFQTRCFVFSLITCRRENLRLTTLFFIAQNTTAGR